jgi:hypothetical protein
MTSKLHHHNFENPLDENSDVSTACSSHASNSYATVKRTNTTYSIISADVNYKSGLYLFRCYILPNEDLPALLHWRVTDIGDKSREAILEE